MAKFLKDSALCQFCGTKDWVLHDFSGVYGTSSSDIYYECDSCGLQIYTLSFPLSTDVMRKEALAHYITLTKSKTQAQKQLDKYTNILNKMTDELTSLVISNKLEE